MHKDEQPCKHGLAASSSCRTLLHAANKTFVQPAASIPTRISVSRAARSTAWPAGLSSTSFTAANCLDASRMTRRQLPPCEKDNSEVASSKRAGGLAASCFHASKVTQIASRFNAGNKRLVHDHLVPRGYPSSHPGGQKPTSNSHGQQSS
ncbi:hypothetical protein Dimus_016857, partial [Dionaea muscipula]